MAGRGCAAAVAVTAAWTCLMVGIGTSSARADCAVTAGQGTVDAPAAGTAITCDGSAPNPFVGPVGGQSRRDGWSATIGTGAVINGGVQATYPAGGGFFIIVGDPADVPMLDRRIGVYAGAGTTIFNAGEIRSGDNLVPTAPPPAPPPAVHGVSDYLGILDPVPFDAGASRSSAETVAGGARSQAEAAVAAGGQVIDGLKHRLVAAEANRPEPWIDPRDISGIVLDPRYPGSGGGGGFTMTIPGFPPFTTPEPERFGIDVTDGTTLVNAGVIIATNDAVRAGSDNRIVNAGSVESSEDNGFVLGDRNRVANTGAIVAELDGIIAGADNTVLNAQSGTIAAGRTGVAAGTGTTAANAGSIAAGEDGVAVGATSGVLNAETGTISAAETAIVAGSGTVIENHGALFGRGGIRGGAGTTSVNTGLIEAEITGIGVEDGGTILNSGRIAAQSSGVRVDGGGTVVNNGEIAAGSTGIVGDGSSVLVNGGMVEADWIGMALFYGGTMLNRGTVTSTTEYGAGLHIAFGTAVNEGTVEAAGDGIEATEGAVVVNSGRVSAIGSGVRAVEADVAVLNRGVLGGLGGTAVGFNSGGNTLVLDTGSELQGAAVGGERQYDTDVDTLILAGRGREDDDIVGFERMAMLGEDWTLSGTVAADEVLVATGSLAVGGRLAGNTVVYRGATLGGGGIVTGTIISDGDLEPGGADAFAGLTVDGDVVVNGPSRLILEIGDVGAGAFDVLTVTDDVFFNGVLELVFTDPAALEDGDAATVLSYDGLLIGPDFKVMWPALPDGLDVDLAFDGDGLDVLFSAGSGEGMVLGLSAGAPFHGIRSELATFQGLAVVAAVAEPSTLALLGLGLFGVFRIRRRA